MIDALPLLLGPEGYQISRSVRLRSSASATFSRTPASASNRTTWTWSGWVKGGFSDPMGLFAARSDATNGTEIRFTANAALLVSNVIAGTSNGLHTTNAVYRDPSAWYHIVVAVDVTNATAANRFQIYVNGVLQAVTITTAVTTSNTFVNSTAVHYIGDNRTVNGKLDGYLTEINFIDGQSLPAGLSNWAQAFGETNPVTGVWQPKKYTGTYGTNGFYLNFSDPSAAENRLIYSELVGSTGWSPGSVTVTANSIVAPNGSTTASLITANNADANVNQTVAGVTNGVTYTFSVWLKSTSNTPIRLYADTSGSGTYVFMDVNVTTTWARYSLSFTATGTTVQVVIGAGSSFSSPEILHAWGAQLNSGAGAGAYIRTVASPATGVVALGQDFSLGDQSFNTWTANNISVTAGVTYDSMLDVPTPWADGGNGRGNYCTLNPLDNSQNAATGTLSNGNLTRTDSTATNTATFGTMFVSSGQWYYEVLVQAISSTTANCFVALSTNGKSVYVALRPDGSVLNCTKSGSGTYTTNDVLGVAVDIGANSVSVYKNGTLIYTLTPTTALTDFTPSIADGTTLTGAVTASFNFGQQPFSYTPPSGFLALNTQNLPTPTIAKGNQFFDATLYTGDGTNNRLISNAASMQPDLVWIKERSNVVGASHIVIDSARGANYLLTNGTAAEVANSVLGWSNAGPAAGGFKVDQGTNGSINQNTATFVGWQWKEGATQGFDIVTYTGNGANRTIAHNLGVAPSMMIVKGRNFASSGWIVWHSALLGTEYLSLEATNAKATAATVWNSTVPTSSVFSLGTNTQVNQNTSTFVAYLFAQVAGFSRFGSYTGNGSTDGPFVFCGFRPRFVMVKQSSGVNEWVIVDTARNAANAMNANLYPNRSNAEDTSITQIDALSNGFKLREGNAGWQNINGQTYIFAAFAENPFKYSLAR